MVKSHLACAYFKTTCTQREPDRDWSFAADSGEKGLKDAAAGNNGDLEWKKRAGGAFPISDVSEHAACYGYLESHMESRYGTIYNPGLGSCYASSIQWLETQCDSRTAEWS